MNVRTLTRSFAGGEVTPEFWGRIDDVKYQTGLATCLNFIPLPHGPIQNRPGTKFVREVKDSTKKTRLIPFVYSSTQTFAIELGAGYFRFHTQGATLLASGATAWSSATAYVVGDLVTLSGTTYYCIAAHTNQTPPNATYWYALPASGVYEIPNPYAEADLFNLHFVQSSDVLTIVHPGYAPRELKRLSASKWTLTTIPFAATLSGPASAPTLAVTGGTTNAVDTLSYKITAVTAENEESLASPAATTASAVNLANGGAKIEISWSAVSGAVAYNVYKAISYGTFGYIGQATGTNFRDTNITPDGSLQPPTSDNPFATDYPGAVSYFEQRRCFGGTTAKPQTIFMTRSGTESNLTASTPSRDDDSIRFRVAAREYNVIRHIVPLTNLMLLTSEAEWRVTSINSDALTPSSISVRPQSYIGSSNVQPVIVNNNLIFAAARGGHMRELAYNWQASGYITGDLSLRAPHLFDGLTISDMGYSKSPYPVIWAVSSNGRLLGFTYVPEQGIGAWHQHSTDGLFESVCVVSEGDEDAIYVVVNRTIGGSTKRYVERFASRQFSVVADGYFVDCGLTYSGSPATTISGLSHLNGKTVSILADGAVHPARVVAGGQVTLDQAASKVHVGLPYSADAKTLPMAIETMAYGQGREKNVNTVWLRVYRSSGIFAGPDETTLTESKQRTNEPYGSPPSLKTEEIRLPITPSWQDSGQVFIRQKDPLPLTIVSMTLEVAIGS